MHAMFSIPCAWPAVPRNLSHLLLLVAGIATTGLSLYYLVRKSRRRPAWVTGAGRVTQLIVYPIKSVAGIPVPEVRVTPTGFQLGPFHDRCMILLSKDRRMITQRHDPRLALIQTRVSEDGESIILSAPEMPDLVVTLRGSSGPDDEVYKFTIWSTPIEGVEVSAECSRWFSQYLGQEATLVQHLPAMRTRMGFAESAGGTIVDPQLQIVYQDGSPVHLVNEASVAAVNDLLPAGDEARFGVRNFRPNIVTSGPAAHDEENWLYVRINGVVCKNVRLCTRCSIPTIDQDRGVKVSSKSETLRRFRSPAGEYEQKNYDADPLFGNNLLPQSSGSLALGMSLDVSFK